MLNCIKNEQGKRLRKDKFIWLNYRILLTREKKKQIIKFSHGIMLRKWLWYINMYLKKRKLLLALILRFQRIMNPEKNIVWDLRNSTVHPSCVVWQLWARGPWYHLLNPVATAHSHSSLLHQLFVLLLPPPSTAAHVLLLWEDPAGCPRCSETGQLGVCPLTSVWCHTSRSAGLSAVWL